LDDRRNPTLAEKRCVSRLLRKLIASSTGIASVRPISTFAASDHQFAVEIYKTFRKLTAVKAPVLCLLWAPSIAKPTRS
jgi:hypothetical protein